MSVGDRVRAGVRVLGELLITAGIVVLLFCVYELKVTSIYAEDQQKSLDKTLTQLWAGPSGPQGPALPVAANGAGVARIYFPTLGKKEVHVVVEGVSHDDLKKGPGHYPGTELPGQLGNMMISGHRTTYGAPFNRLDELHPGDPIVLETRTAFYTYTVQRVFVVKPTAIGETYHVPNKPGAIPTQRLLTLATCNPKYSARQRLIVRAILTSTVKKNGPGVVPPALGGS
jgi:sortase A